MSSYLRTNTRLTGREIDANAIGGGIRNFLEGSMGIGINGRGSRFYGGFVMWSIAEQNTGTFSTAANSIIAQYYGVTMASNILGGANGFRIVPVAAYAISETSNLFQYFPNLSLGTDSIAFITAKQVTMSTGPSNLILTAPAASISQHLMCIGFIASTPFAPFG